jgi:hypothetical protein
MNQTKNLSTSSRCATIIWAVALALIICSASAGKFVAAAAIPVNFCESKKKERLRFMRRCHSAMSIIPPAP